MDPRSQYARLLPLARAIRARTSVILLYHGLGTPEPEHDPENLQVSPEAFRRQVGLLRDAGFQFVTVADLAGRIAPGGSPPRGLAAISFDDGMEDNFSIAAPILAELGFPATIYVTTGTIGGANPWMAPAAGARMMDAAQLRSLADDGIEIGAHTVSHPDLSRLDYDGCRTEMEQSKQTLEEIVERPVTTFAYPFGHYGDAAVRAARDTGFAAAATCVNRGSWDPFELKRRLITGRDGAAAFTLRAAGIYEPLVLGRAGSLARRVTRGLRGRG